MSHRASLFWLVIISLFFFWTVRVLFLPSPQTVTGEAFVLNTVLRMLFFFLPVFLGAILLRDPLRDVFALHLPKLAGSIIAALYSLGLIFFELTERTISLTNNPWILLNFPFAPIIEELVFRGFLFTHLQKTVGDVQAVLLSSILFTFIHFPGWIFVAGLQGENFLTVTGQVFFFGLVQGVIRLVSKSVYPSITVHLVNNFLAVVV